MIWDSALTIDIVTREVRVMNMIGTEMVRDLARGQARVLLALAHRRAALLLLRLLQLMLLLLLVMLLLVDHLLMIGIVV